MKPFLVLLSLLAVTACAGDPELIDRGEACAEQAAAWCAAAVPGDDDCSPWYVEQCDGPEPMLLDDHAACMDVLAGLADHRELPIVPGECFATWPAPDGGP